MSKIEQLFSLKGRTALVTGAGTGMGRQFAATLAQAGATVVCVARNLERLEQAVAQIRKDGGKAIAVAADVGSSESVEVMFDRAEQQVGRVNILVNCAAQVDFGGVTQMQDESWNNLINVNLSGVMRTCRSFARRLIEAGEGGSIVNVTSISGMQVMPGLLTYGTLKAATTHLTRALAVELFDSGIRVNAIAPGYFHTEMAAALFESEPGRALVERYPPKRLGRVEELDGPLLLLASDASCHMNGAVLAVDAGHSVRMP